MARRDDVTRHVDDAFRHGRSYPSGQPHDQRHPKPVHQSEFHRHIESQEPQAREDQRDHRGGNYFNDAQGWVRGAPHGQEPTGNNETAADKPGAGLDKGQSWRRADKGNDWRR